MSFCLVCIRHMEGETVAVDRYLWPHRPGPNDRLFDRQTATVVVTEHRFDSMREPYREHFLVFDDGEPVSQFDKVDMECRCADRKRSRKSEVRSTSPSMAIVESRPGHHDRGVMAYAGQSRHALAISGPPASDAKGRTKLANPSDESSRAGATR